MPPLTSSFIVKRRSLTIRPAFPILDRAASTSTWRSSSMSFTTMLARRSTMRGTFWEASEEE